MAVITTPASTQYPWYVRIIFWLQRRKYGTELEPARLWGRAPGIFLALTFLYRAIDRRGSPLSPALRSLVTVWVSQINWCAFCVDLNSATALERSVSAEKIAELPRFRESVHYTDQEKIALAFAEAVTRTEGKVDAGMVQELKRYFSDDAIIELTALIAFQNMSSKFNAALDVQPHGFCALPNQLPGE